jgi:flagellar basal-body rod modification protein FlgD
MAVSPVSGPSQSNTAAAASSGLSQNFDAFLMLLTTQLKNQDPLSPLESTEFVTQLVQFSAVEQAIHQRQSLENLVNLQLAWQATNAVGYIGKTIDVSGEHAFLKDGSAEFKYTLEEDAGKTTITIKNAFGEVVREIAGEKTKGPHTLTWDGKNNDGVAQPDGQYSITISATKGQDIAVKATTTFSGVVTAIDSAGGQVLLRVGNARISIGDVTSVRETPPPAPPSS